MIFEGAARGGRGEMRGDEGGAGWKREYGRYSESMGREREKKE